MTVVGIGGIFFRSSDPETLQEWYRRHLGVVTTDASPWMQQSGPTMIMPFPRDIDYFPATKAWMINFRVKDLDKLLSALRDAGIEVITNPHWNTPDTGRFARVYDPEGNPVELWEPSVE